MIQYTDEQKLILSLVNTAQTQPNMLLQFLPAVNNDTGDEEMLLGGVVWEDGSWDFYPLARCFGKGEHGLDKYTIDLDKISFTEDNFKNKEDFVQEEDFHESDCDCDDCIGYREECAKDGCEDCQAFLEDNSESAETTGESDESTPKKKSWKDGLTR